MRYTKNNITYEYTKKAIKRLPVVGYHDCEIKDFQYNYDEKVLHVTFCEETKSRNDLIYAVFKDVVYCEIQNFDFWGPGYNVFSLNIIDDPEVWERLETLKNKQIECGNDPYEYDLSEMIIVAIHTNSGAVFDIVCRSMEDSQ